MVSYDFIGATAAALIGRERLHLQMLGRLSSAVFPGVVMTAPTQAQHAITAADSRNIVVGALRGIVKPSSHTSINL